MIRVLHLRDTDKLCGPGKTILETADRIDKKNYRIYIGVFVRKYEDHNKYIEVCRKRGVDVIPIKMSNPLDLAVVIRVIKIAKKLNINIIHAHEYKSDIVAVLVKRLHRVHIMTTAHGWINHGIKRKAYVALGKLFLSQMEAIVAVSPKIKEELLERGILEDRIKLVFNAIVMEDYNHAMYSKEYLKAIYGLPSQSIIVSCIGRLSPEKGQQELVKAAAIVLEEIEHVYFIFVGDGPDRYRLETLAKQLGCENRVLFTGHLNDIRGALYGSDMMVLPSYTEGFPNVILESLTMSVPVIASNVGGVANIVENERTGLLIEPGKPKAIASAIMKYISRPDYAMNLAIKGREKVEEKYQFSKRVEIIQRIYKEISNA